MNKLITGTLVSLGLVTAAPMAIAQTTAPAAETAKTQHAQRHHQRERAFRMPSERVEARLAYLKTALKITDAQQSQWEGFADVHRKYAKAADERIKAFREQGGQRAKGTRPTAIERLERRQKMLTAQSQRVGELAEAGKPLYAALSEEQRRIADRMLAPRGKAGFQHRGKHRRA
ncbi:MAG: Spy/CpxP family protein refolding chaperone [Burkholderiales bacterium]|nr:Spy/CpxP family protein refolding chaperone [Burkholderiales bacterium]